MANKYEEERGRGSSTFSLEERVSGQWTSMRIRKKEKKEGREMRNEERRKKGLKWKVERK